MPGAAGNVAAEDAVHLIHGLGLRTGIDLEQLCQVADYYQLVLNKSLPGRMYRLLSRPNMAAAPINIEMASETGRGSAFTVSLPRKLR